MVCLPSAEPRWAGCVRRSDMPSEPSRLFAVGLREPVLPRTVQLAFPFDQWAWVDAFYVFAPGLQVMLSARILIAQKDRCRGVQIAGIACGCRPGCPWRRRIHAALAAAVGVEARSRARRAAQVVPVCLDCAFEPGDEQLRSFRVMW